MKHLLIALVGLSLTGCLSYDGDRYLTLAAAEAAATAVTAQRCDAHEVAARALREGPNRAAALPLVGSGAAMADIAREHEVAAVVCRQAVQRGLNDQRLLDAWRRVWEAGAQEVR